MSRVTLYGSTPRNHQGVFALILLAFGLLALAYSLTTPTFEAPDEIHHYRYVRALINTGRPPAQQAGQQSFGHHAPLYYALVALPAFWVGEDDLAVWGEPESGNPFFGYEFGQVGRDNKNIFLHPPYRGHADRLGESDTWLGLRVARWASILMGALTVWIVYRVGRELYPERPALGLGAAILVAFIPQFLFISAALNDDNGATLFGSLALWAMTRLVLRGPNPRRALALGLALGAGWLAKLTVVALVPAAGLALWLALYRQPRFAWRDLVRYGLITFGVTLILVAPWVVRQMIEYGEPTGTGGEFEFGGQRERPVALSDLGPDLFWLRTTFWGRLGANQIPMDRWIYWILDLATGAATLGLLARAAHRLRAGGWAFQRWSARQTVLFLYGMTILLLASPLIVRRFMRPMPNFGRYLFPALPAIAVLFVVGLLTWLPRWRRPRLAVQAGLVLAMPALGLAALLFYLGPAYARPPIYADPAAVNLTCRLDWVYLTPSEAPLARLLGFDVQPEAARPGQTVQVTLYWQALAPDSEDYVLFAQLFGRGGAKVGQRDTFPGLGHYPTRLWQPGQVIVDRVPVPVAEDAAGPSRLRLDVGLYPRGKSGERLGVVDSQGDPVSSATAGWLKLTGAPPQWEPLHPTGYVFGGAVTLDGYDLVVEGGQVHLNLYWRCLAPFPADYTVFVHLLDAQGALLAQADGPPVGGDYATSLWEPGERILDGRSIPLPANAPPGPYAVRMGFYLLETGDRLTLADGSSQVVLPEERDTD